MAFEAFDARKRIRTAIGTDYINTDTGQLEECIVVTDSNSDTLNVPMFTREYVEVYCPPTPFITIDLLSIPATPHDIGADTRYHRCLVAFDIVFDDADNINVENFGKKVADKIVDLTRDNQCSITGIDFMNVHNQGRLWIENRCENVVLHWIMELEAAYYGAR